MVNLNKILVEDHTNNPNSGWEHNMPAGGRDIQAATSSDGQTRVYFDGLENRLCELIAQSDAVLGCVAWLTSEPILKALAKKRAVAIVVQKEDFLRPDIHSPYDWKASLRRLYEALPYGFDRYHFNGRVGRLSVCCDPTLAAVRCAGIYNSEKSTTCPRMHHKFLIMARVEEKSQPEPMTYDPDLTRIIPYAVWTGSFNLTRNATFSLENAVVMRDREIVQAYYDEWGHVESLSEPLDWETEWIEPEWRIGT